MKRKFGQAKPTKNRSKNDGTILSPGLLNTEYALTTEELDVLFNRCRLFGIFRQSLPNLASVEVLRWNALASMRESFRLTCSEKGLNIKELPSGSWEKWHAGLMATATPDTDPVIPDITHKDASIRKSISTVIYGELLKAGLDQISAGEVASALNNFASEAAVSLTANKAMLLSDTVTEPAIVIRHVDKAVVLTLPASSDRACGPELRITSSHYEKLQRLWELNNNHRRQLAGLRRIKDTAGCGESSSEETAEFHR